MCLCYNIYIDLMCKKTFLQHLVKANASVTPENSNGKSCICILKIHKIYKAKDIEGGKKYLNNCISSPS